MSQSKNYEVNDLVMFSTKLGGERRYFGVVVWVGEELNYSVRFYDEKARSFNRPMAITHNEVQWIGPLPHGTVLDWDG